MRRYFPQIFVTLAAIVLITGVVITASSGVVQNDVTNSQALGLAPEPVIEEPPAESSWEPMLTAVEVDAFGRELASHVAALSRHQAIFDRPHHPPITVPYDPEHSLLGIRRRWHLRTHELAALNPDLDLDHLRRGTDLVVWRYDPENPARSYMRPNRGRLRNGELMPLGNGWVIRNERLAFGATQTIDALVHAVRVVQAEHPGGQDLMVADISRQTGGSFRPHRSHHSGRDVDVTYYRNSTEPPEFRRVRPQHLDAARTWTFVRTLLTDHDVVYIFMSRQLQVRLFEYAESIGEHPAWLSEVFQYGPRRHRNHSAIIRFARGHHDHMHIRFPCTDEDIRCRGAR